MGLCVIAFLHLLAAQPVLIHPIAHAKMPPTVEDKNSKFLDQDARKSALRQSVAREPLGGSPVQVPASKAAKTADDQSMDVGSGGAAGSVGDGSVGGGLGQVPAFPVSGPPGFGAAFG